MGSLSWTNGGMGEPENLLVRPRSRAPATPIKMRQTGHGAVEVVFLKPQRALAPGQICAFYDGETLLGGGIFEEILG